MDTETVKYLENQFRRLGMEAKDFMDAGDRESALQRLGMMFGINLAIESSEGRSRTRLSMLRVVGAYLA
jgi:hypothetical protein